MNNCSYLFSSNNGLVVVNAGNPFAVLAMEKMCENNTFLSDGVHLLLSGSEVTIRSSLVREVSFAEFLCKLVDENILSEFKNDIALSIDENDVEFIESNAESYDSPISLNDRMFEQLVRMGFSRESVRSHLSQCFYFDDFESAMGKAVDSLNKNHKLHVVN